MIVPNARCINNGKKLNEVIEALNNVLFDAVVSEQLDVVDPSNQPGKRWFVIGQMTDQNQSSGGSDRDKLSSNSSTQNRDQLTISANVGTTTGGAGMPIAPGEAGFRGGGGQVDAFGNRVGAAGMPIAPGEAGFGGGGGGNDRPADDIGGGGGGGGGAAGNDAIADKIAAKRALKDRSGIDNGEPPRNTVGDAPVTDRDAAIAAKIAAKRAMKDRSGIDGSGQGMPIAPGEAGYTGSNASDRPADDFGGSGQGMPIAPGEAGYTGNQVSDNPADIPPPAETTAPASSPKQSSYAADYTADDIDKFIRGRGKNPDTMSQAEKDSIMQSMNQGRGTVSRRNNSR